jgi:hypothetical protein
MAATCRSITQALAAEGRQIELVRGTGYFYFNSLAPECYETESVYVNTLNQLSREEWLQQGRELAVQWAAR